MSARFWFSNAHKTKFAYIVTTDVDAGGGIVFNLARNGFYDHVLSKNGFDGRGDYLYRSSL